jgi:hypothetical protein
MSCCPPQGKTRAPHRVRVTGAARAAAWRLRPNDHARHVAFRSTAIGVRKLGRVSPRSRRPWRPSTPTLGDEPEPDLSTVDALIDKLERQAALLSAAATRGPRIDDVKREYQDRRWHLAEALKRRGLEYPFRGRTCGSGTATGPLTTSALMRRRRAKIRDLAASIAALERQPAGSRSLTPGLGRSHGLNWTDGLVGRCRRARQGGQPRRPPGRRSPHAHEILIDCAGLLADPSSCRQGKLSRRQRTRGCGLICSSLRVVPAVTGRSCARFICATWELA